jgi:tetratricopeptide (TPR) repeat protein
MKFLKYILLFLLISQQAFSQKDEATLAKIADQFYSNKEYDKALEYYEKLYDKNENVYFGRYLQCLNINKEFKRAEKIAKRQIKSNPQELNYYLDLANVYFQSGEAEKGEDQYKKAIKQLSGSTVQCVSLGQAFMSIKSYEYAIETYLKGRKLTTDYPFTYELAEAYHAKGESKLMINEYLDLLETNEGELPKIQSALQSNLAKEDENGLNNPLLKNELQRRMVNKSESIVLVEFYIWLLLQQKDFESAFIQCKAIDKRKNEDGFRLMELGKTCTMNDAFVTAQKCFDYVLTKGKESYYYTPAQIEGTIARYEKYIRQAAIASDETEILEKQFAQVMAEYGITKQTFILLKKYAQFKALYKSDIKSATDLLQKGIENRSIESSAKADLKLDLADLLLASGDVWEASLLYSQVDKAFKYDPIGQEAKFRNAKLAFYNGDFTWSKAQLDVLKGATSKLISNDAMDLSLVIGDALAEDTIETPLVLFAQADLLIIQNKFALANAKFDSIHKYFPDHSLNDNILMKKAEMALKQSKFEEAIAFFKTVIEKYPDDIFGDDAFFKIAEIYHYKLADFEKAKTQYKEFILQYTGSVYAVEASKRYRLLRGDQIK